MMMQLMIYLVAYGEICGAYGDFMKFDYTDKAEILKAERG